MCGCSQSFRSFLKNPVRCAVVAFGLFALCAPAAAYRPFDGTDAAAAKKGDMEIELQPVNRRRTKSH